jgi:AhpD family alkylhydroperoxidase
VPSVAVMESSIATPVGLERKDKELVAVAASLAAGCIPCTEHHSIAVREAGASESEVRWAGVLGMAVKRRSLAVMGALATERLGLVTSRVDAASEFEVDKPRLAPLVTLAAAVAAHCVPALEQSVSHARRLAWPEPDIRRALGIGRMVRETGARKADEAASRLLEPVAEEGEGDA